MKVHELMSKDVATIEQSDTLKEAARIMMDRKISGLPVLDDSHSLVGILTEGDILHQESLRSPSATLRSLFRGSAKVSTVVAEVMTKKVISIGAEADHTEAARLMESTGVKRLPVLSRSGALLGIISRSDILKAFGRPDSDIRTEISTDVIERILWVDPKALTVEVEEGVVTLSGRVPTKADARILEEMSRRIDGVVKVEADRVEFEVDDTRSSGSQMSGPGSRPYR